MKDLSLFDEDTDYRTLRPIRDVEGLARFGDPDTSYDAAQKISGRTERRIMSAMRAKQQAYPSLGRDHGLTDDEIVDWIGTVHPPTVKSARSRLSRRGLLVDSGVRRPSLTGSPMIVWKLGAVEV